MENLSVAVVVPSYERPEMVRNLIDSFLVQDYQNKNIYIFDDSKSTKILDLTNEYKNSEIQYIKNSGNLGYCENLKKCLFTPIEDIVIILGDDDIFLSKDAISTYVQIFSSEKNVGYIYAHQAQIDEYNNIDYTTSGKNTLFHAGKEALDSMILSSIFIPGMAFRRDFYDESFYPRETLLFPQLFFTAKMITLHDSFLLGKCLIGGRAHSGQLGFAAIKNENIKGGELHGTIEIIDLAVAGAMTTGYKYSTEKIEKELLGRYITGILKEVLIVGRKNVKNTYYAYIQHSEYAKNNLKLKFMFSLSQILPYKIIHIIRNIYLFMRKKQDSIGYITSLDFINENIKK